MCTRAGWDASWGHENKEKRKIGYLLLSLLLRQNNKQKPLKGLAVYFGSETAVLHGRECLVTGVAWSVTVAAFKFAFILMGRP